MDMVFLLVAVSHIWHFLCGRRRQRIGGVKRQMGSAWWCSGTLLAMGTPHAILDIALRIGQANLFVAGIMGVVMGLSAFGLYRLAITASLLGASVKLVPAIALVPIGLRFSAREPYGQCCVWDSLSLVSHLDTSEQVCRRPIFDCGTTANGSLTSACER